MRTNIHDLIAQAEGSAMGFKDIVPSFIKKPLKGARHSMHLLGRSARNAANGFRPVDLDYRVAIDRLDDLDIAYRVGTSDEDVLKDSFAHDIFFTAVPEYHPALDDTIIDVGAHIGTFSLLAATKVRNGKVFAIEACQDTFNILRINVALNQFWNVEAFHFALSDAVGQTTLHYDEENWGHSIMKRLSPQGETVATDTLAAFMDRNSIDRCNFLKFNCEGAEFPIVLSTSIEMLQRIERMLILYHCDLANERSADKLVRHLHAAGFHSRLFNQTPQRGWLFAQRDGTGA
jgi:FkbM family methyltransferase